MGKRSSFFFTRAGSVESFPLPDNCRRFVLRTRSYVSGPVGEVLRTGLAARTGIHVAQLPLLWESSFRVQHFLAAEFARGRIFLAGDAAHVMSPVGGQNMNTGFADAELAAWLAARVCRGEVPFDRARDLYNDVRRKAAAWALQRARLLTLLATSGGRDWSPLRGALLRLLFHTPLSPALARQFSMLSSPYRNLEPYRDRFETRLGLTRSIAAPLETR